MPTAEVRRRPPGRYDEQTTASRVVSILGAALLALGLVALLFGLYERRTGSQLRYQVGSYDVVSDAAVRVRFTVNTGGTKTGLCRVRARNADGAEAGVAVIEVGPGREVSYLLSTTSRAVTGEVTGCRRT